jgi:uncharacterized membrane protein
MEQSVLLQRLSHLSLEPNPALLEHARERAESLQNRIADRITAFAGSMRFVYLHLLWFGCWIGFRVEGYPYGLLTMIVSLEAIFLSTCAAATPGALIPWGGRCRHQRLLQIGPAPPDG